MDIIAELSPNNQFLITTLTKRPTRSVVDRSEQRIAERLARSYSDFSDSREALKLVPSIDTFRVKYSDGVTRLSVGVYNSQQSAISYVPISDLEEDHKNAINLLDIRRKSQSISSGKDSWGERRENYSFSKRGRSQLLRAGGAIEKKGLGGDCFAVTLTIPGSGSEVFDCVARWSGWFANRLTQELRNAGRSLEDRSSLGYFYVWELQKRGALHLHWCLIGYPEEVSYRLKDKWFQLLQELSAKQQLDLFQTEQGGSWSENPSVWQWRVQKVTRSVAGYFAKYCSKAASASKGGNVFHDRDSTLQVSPGRWYSISASVRSWIKEYTVKVEVSITSKEDEQIYLNRILAVLSPEAVTGVLEWSFAVRSKSGSVVCAGTKKSIFLEEQFYPSVLAAHRALRQAIISSNDRADPRLAAFGRKLFRGNSESVDSERAAI